jgi:hypothetical protein
MTLPCLSAAAVAFVHLSSPSTFQTAVAIYLHYLTLTVKMVGLVCHRS